MDTVKACRQKFIDAMDDDLNTADALAAVFDIIYEANTRLSESERNNTEAVRLALDTIHELGSILGLFEKSGKKDISAEVEELIKMRAEARAAKNWAEADAIRDRLREMNIELKDTPMGVKWNYIE